MAINAQIVLNWEKLIEQAGLPVTSVSSKIKSRSYLSSLFGAARKTPNNIPEPSITVVSRLADILGMTLDDMMQVKSRVRMKPDPSYQSSLGQHAQKIIDDLSREIARRQSISAARPSVEDVVNWWRENNGRLEACDNIKEGFDLIEVPKAGDKSITARHVGQCSLAALHLGANTDRLARLLDLLPEKENHDMVVSYQTAAKVNKPRFSDPLQMAVSSPRDGIALRADYIRVQLPVVAPDNTKLIVSYCF